MSIKLLVADDSITIQKVIGIIFSEDEYSLTIVDNGRAAVDKAREINPDILLIDALMPGISGYEATEMIRATPALSTTPILILTGSFEAFDEKKAKECGADDFISKPFESQQIINKVKELLEIGRSRCNSAQTVQTSQAEAIPEVPAEKSPDFSKPLAPDDIWGAFTSEVEEPVETATIEEIVTPPATAPAMQNVDLDIFAIVSEEQDAEIVDKVVSTNISPTHTGSEWIPVEENTFEFDEGSAAETFQTSFTEQMPPDKASSFGDITFEEEAETASLPPSFESAPRLSVDSVPLPVDTVLTDPIAITGSLPQFTDEQLKAAVSSVSKEVIERIVWEIVPDLAETLIRDAIRKIKEGV